MESERNRIAADKVHASSVYPLHTLYTPSVHNLTRRPGRPPGRPPKVRCEKEMVTLKTAVAEGTRKRTELIRRRKEEVVRAAQEKRRALQVETASKRRAQADQLAIQRLKQQMDTKEKGTSSCSDPYARARTRTHIYTHTRALTLSHINTHTRAYNCIHVRAHTHIRTRAHSHSHTYIHLCARTHTHTHVQCTRLSWRPKTRNCGSLLCCRYTTPHHSSLVLVVLLPLL